MVTHLADANAIHAEAVFVAVLRAFESNAAVEALEPSLTEAESVVARAM